MSRKEEILEELNDALRERTPIQGDALRAALREHRHAAPAPRAMPWRVAFSTGLALASVAGISLLSQPPSLSPATRTHPATRTARVHPPLRQGRVGVERNERSRGGFKTGGFRSRGVGSRDAMVDDLTFLNAGGEPDAYAAQVATLVKSEAETLTAPLPEITGGDSFVEVPLPQLAARGESANAAALRSYQDEKAISDPRLQRKVTLAKKAVAFGELLEQLAKETGIDISATRGVADDKLTVFCKDKPLRDLMRQITQHFGFTWERTGSDPAYGYRLKQPLRNQFLEEELRNKDRHEALLALDREMESLKKHFDLSPEQAREAAENAEGKEKDQLELLGGIGWAPARLYFGLSPEDQSALQGGKKLYFGENGTPFPKELAQGTLNALTGHAFIDGDGISINSSRKAAGEQNPKGKSPAEVGAKPAAMLELQRDELGQVSLYAHTGFSQGGSAAMNGVPLATGVSPSVASPKNAEANAAKKKLPAYQKSATVSLARKGLVKWTSADALEAIHKATGRDVLGDYFTRLVPYKEEKGSLFEVLAHTCDPLRLRWDEKEGWLTFRSTDFFNMRLKEVPTRLLERWAAQRKAAGKLSPEELRELSRLTDDQLNASSMAEGAKELYGLAEWDIVRSETTRPIWRFYDSLPTPLRTAMQSEKGLAFSQLGLEGRQKFVKAAYQHNPDRITQIQQGGASEAFLKRLEAISQLRLVPGSDAINDTFAFEFTLPSDFGTGLTRKRVSNGGTSISTQSD